MVALLTDAGTPSVSDPGAQLVAAVAAAGLPVSPLPGPSAVIATLSVAGLRGDRWLFEGFLPRQQQRRRQRLMEWQQWPGAIVFFEAPHRLAATAQDLVELFPSGYLVVARELTKRHEEILRGPIAEVVAQVAAKPPRGEYTLVLWPRPEYMSASAMGPS